MSVSKLSRKVLDEFVKSETLESNRYNGASTTPRKARPRQAPTDVALRFRSSRARNDVAARDQGFAEAQFLVW